MAAATEKKNNVLKVKIDQLVQDDINANKGTEYGQHLIENSLRKFGAGRSILLDKNNRIIAGNKTIENAAAIGLDNVIVVETTGKQIVAVKRTDIDLDSADGREMAIADNASAKANIEWDPENIKMITQEWKVDVESWGIELPELAPAVEGKEDDYEIPDEIKTDIVLGDLFEIGEHRLLCGDSTDSDSVARLMNGQKADMIHTDPPYGVNYEGGHNKKKRKGIKNDALQGCELTDLFYDSLLNACLFSKETAAFYIWYASGKSVETYASFKNLDLELRAVIQWYKVHSGLGAFMSQYIPNCEPCMYAHKRGYSPKWYGASDEKTVWELQRNGISEYHPTQKPIELPARAIKNSSVVNDIILDLFCGGGSTMVASHQLNRKCYGMELDPKYCQVIIDRMRKLDPTLTIKRNGEVMKFDN